MKLEKALEITKWALKIPDPEISQDFYDALELLIKAGEREMEYRESMPVKKGELLPGETED